MYHVMNQRKMKLPRQLPLFMFKVLVLTIQAVRQGVVSQFSRS